jgi:hypothetical protein
MGAIILVGFISGNLEQSIWINNIILALVVAWNSYQNWRSKAY